MRAYELPLIEEDKSVEQQLRQIKSFLYRQAENLNYNLKNSDVVSLWKQTAEALSVAENDEVEQLRRDEFKALRGLIIKSATSVVKNEESFSAFLKGDYEAQSEHGVFSEQGSIYINGNPYTIGQIYKYQSEIVTDVNRYKTELEGYIKTGTLERDTSNPVFGMEIGYNKDTYTVNGKVYQNENPAKIRITPTKIGFYQGNKEVAYLQNSAIYFPAAHITGGSIKIGDNFSVDNSGKMLASQGTFKGSVYAGAGFIGGFQIRGSSKQEGNYWPCSFSSIITPNDGKENDDYQYVVFIRGNYAEDGSDYTYGAIDTTHMVFGIKKRKKSVTDWDNENAPYVYNVSLKGEIHCEDITPKKISADLFKVNSNLIQIGSTDYKKPINITAGGTVTINGDKAYIYTVSGAKITGDKVYIETEKLVSIKGESVVFSDKDYSYSFRTMVEYMQKSRSMIETAESNILILNGHTESLKTSVNTLESNLTIINNNLTIVDEKTNALRTDLTDILKQSNETNNTIINALNKHEARLANIESKLGITVS